MPLISVIMGVFYQKPDITFLVRSVNSILAQTIQDLELLICPDGSSAEAISYLRNLAERDSRVHLVWYQNHYSLPEKLNACLRESSGKWIARMDDDDYSHPDRLEKQLHFFCANPDLAFLGCCANLYRDGQFIGQRIFPLSPKVQDFYFTQPFLHPTLLLRRDALNAVNGYSERLSCRLCEDYDLLLRLYHAGYRGANLPDILFDYTLPPTGKVTRSMKHRWNETVTRYHRFSELHLLPQAFPWIIKPLLVGLIPHPLLEFIKNRWR